MFDSCGIQTTPLERLLFVERERRRADLVRKAGFARPAMGERPLEEESGPLLATNMRSQLVPTRVSSTGMARYGFSAVSLRDEPLFLTHLVEILSSRGLEFSTLGAAIVWMASKGVRPYHLVLPYPKLNDVCDFRDSREEADAIMASQGYVALLADGIRVIAAEVPTGILVGPPAMAGFYTRSDDQLGLLLTRVDSAWCIVSG